MQRNLEMIAIYKSKGEAALPAVHHAVHVGCTSAGRRGKVRRWHDHEELKRILVTEARRAGGWNPPSRKSAPPAPRLRLECSQM